MNKKQALKSLGSCERVLVEIIQEMTGEKCKYPPIDGFREFAMQQTKMLTAYLRDCVSDTRVGKELKYSFKKLPDGKVWMMENLREPVDGAEWNEEYNCYYYTWEQALKTVPEGYHLPSAGEFMILAEKLGYGQLPNEEVVQKLQDECGFVAAGYYDFDDEKFYGQGSYGDYWSSAQQSTAYAYYLYFNTSGNVYPLGTYGKYLGRTVRCIKD